MWVPLGRVPGLVLGWARVGVDCHRRVTAAAWTQTVTTVSTLAPLQLTLRLPSGANHIRPLC